MRSAALVAALLLASSAAAWACPACYGAGDNTPITNGMTYAVLGMLAITGVMLGLVALGAAHYRKRANALASEAHPGAEASVQSPMTI